MPADPRRSPAVGIEQRAPGRYRIRVPVGRRPNGTPIFREVTHRGPKDEWNSGLVEAKRIRAKLVADVAAGKLKASTATVAEALQAWYEQAEAAGQAPSTLRRARGIIDTHLAPAVGHKRLSALTARDLDGLYARMTAAGAKPATVTRTHAVMSAALRQAERWEWVGVNVARNATPPRQRRPEMVVPPPEAVVAIIREAERDDPVLAGLYALAALTGARRGELCGLMWGDIGPSALTIRRSIYDAPGGGWQAKDTKTHQVRTVSLDTTALAALDKVRGGTGKAAWAFVFSYDDAGRDPVRPDRVTRHFSACARRLGIKANIHQLRHFSATQLIAAGMDPVTVAARLGHATPTTTLRIYAHALSSRDEAAAALLGSILNGGPNALPAPAVP